MSSSSSSQLVKQEEEEGIRMIFHGNCWAGLRQTAGDVFACFGDTNANMTGWLVHESAGECLVNIGRDYEQKL
jgi:hypothetical protein